MFSYADCCPSGFVLGMRDVDLIIPPRVERDVICPLPPLFGKQAEVGLIVAHVWISGGERRDIRPGKLQNSYVQPSGLFLFYFFDICE